MEVGIEDCLHIEFEYNKSKYDHPAAVREPRTLTVDQVPPKGCHRRQNLFSAGSNKDQTYGVVHYSSRDDWSPTEPIQRIGDDHKIRDYGRGTCERCDLTSLNFMRERDAFLSGETIPIRLFLGGFDLTPTFRDVNKKFSTRYYLNLVLIDEENRRYFKQQVRFC
jgi:vacuolar protein sorting-associated protein 26